MELSSKLLEGAVNEFAGLPGIGRKTALRLVLHLLRQEPAQTNGFANALTKLRNEVEYCSECHNISDTQTCSICQSTARNRQIICVVEDIRDVMAIENTGQYNGLYHVLGGIISPMEGIGPADLPVQHLISRVEENSVQEIILALKGTLEGETTAFYIFRKLKDLPVAVTSIARGIGLSDELEYADEMSLGRSILQRTAFDKTTKVAQ